MRAHELKLMPVKNRVRPGRGISAGRGKTAGRGTKGQNSRTGGGVRPGFEGGQNPLSARLPKLAGFSSHRARTMTVTLGQLNRLKTKIVDNVALHQVGITERADQPVKVVVGGQLSSAKTVKLQGASAGAIALIEKAGGSFNAVKRPKRVRSKK
ncbi:MAG TPA: 50S ribosomal protein L15 [Candidatus Saccharimonadales bacterium]